MIDNVVSFELFDSDQQIAAHQAGLPRVVLEGVTDVTLFSRFWFPQWQERVEFIEASRVAAGAGCTGVADAVAHSREEGIPAVGIVDRDTLFRAKDWSRLFSIDPSLISPGPLVTNVYVTSLWEVEAYLLEPDLLADWVAVAHRSPPGSPADCERALPRAIDACEALLAAAGYFAILHSDGKPAPQGLFCDQSLTRVSEVCNEKILGTGPELQAVAEEVRALVTVVRENLPVDQQERFRLLLRYVDTKRLLNRLIHALRVREDAHWILAGFMLKGGRRPMELERLLSAAEAELT